MSANKWWWLSFASKGGFLGAVIVSGEDQPEAARRASKLGINPGGEVLGFDADDPGAFGNYAVDTLLTEADLLACGERKLKDLDPEMRDMANQRGSRICEAHNE